MIVQLIYYKGGDSMIQTLGIILIVIFYIAYFLKLLNQKRRGIQTNQLGRGNKAEKTVVVENLLRISSSVMAVVMFVSAALNKTMFSSLLIRGMGLVLFGLGTYLFILAMVTMKDSWRAGIPEEDKTAIVTTGIYQFSRNPAFLGFDLTYLGACLSFGNIIVLICAVTTITLMHLQILEEEKYLENTFKNQYIVYKNKVGRYILFI
jgi:protein-S-isoprenylcysteine O-methyltransferase Ste14